MTKEMRCKVVSACIDAFTPFNVNPGIFEIRDAVDNMTPKEQLEALLEAIKMHCDQLAGGGFLRNYEWRK